MEKKEKKGTPPPLLLIEYGWTFDENEYSIYNVLENRWDTIRIPTLFDWTPLPCNFGWVVLLNPLTHNCSLWNPKSTEIIQLPELRESYNECVLSKPPDEPGCHILFKSFRTTDLAFCQIGDDEFVEMPIDNNNIKDVESVETLKFFRGNIYAVVGFATRLVTISFVGKTLEFMPMLDISPSVRRLRPWSSMMRYYLIDDGDELLLVCQMFPDYYLRQFSDIRIFRIDINGLECVELLDIGERALFLSHVGNTFCRPSSTGIKPNCIYYVFDERNVCIYNLDNRATTSLPPCLAAPRILHTTYWIEDSMIHN